MYAYNRSFLLGKKKQVAKIFPSFGRKMCVKQRKPWEDGYELRRYTRISHNVSRFGVVYKPMEPYSFEQLVTNLKVEEA